MYGLKQDWLVVQAVPEYPNIRAVFADGSAHRFDLSHLFDRSGVFSKLRDREFFDRAGVVHGAITWPDGTDLAPDAMYAESQRAQELR